MMKTTWTRGLCLVVACAASLGLAQAGKPTVVSTALELDPNPALLLHAILSAQARGITSRMEAAGLSFINEFLKRGATQGT